MRLKHILSNCAILLLATSIYAQQEAMWGFTPDRNLVSDEKNLPTSWDAGSGENIKWQASLGAQSYGGPVMLGGKIFMGTNNQNARNPKIQGDQGVMMAFQESDGKFLWQATHSKLPIGRVNDWPQQGICSTPFIRGDRLYYISNQGHIVCADTEGFLDGENDGPFVDEDEKSEIGADILWEYDMLQELDVFPHNLAVCSPVGAGELLFVITANGVDEGHVAIPSPLAPSFIALNLKTGALVWEKDYPGMNILHGQWSNPAYGMVKGKPQLICPGGDGWIYAMEPTTGELIWKFDCNPKEALWELGGRGTRNAIVATPVIFDNKVFIGVGQDPEHGEGPGHLWAIDATGKGDVTKTHAVWHFGDKNYNRTISTVAIHEGLLYAADLSGYVYCLDLKKGTQYWKYDTFAAVWGSPFVADGKVYLGDEDGDVAIMKAGKKFELINEINMGSAVYTTPVAKDGVLYIGTRNTLFAIKK